MITTAQACQLYRPSAGMFCSRTTFSAAATRFLDQGWPSRFLPTLTEPGGLGRPWSLGLEGLGFTPAPVVSELWVPLGQSSTPAPRVAHPSEGKAGSAEASCLPSS